MNKQEKVISWLKTTEIPISKISKNTGITRQTLYKWINSDSKKLDHIHLKKVKLVYNTYKNYFNEEREINNMEQINQSLVLSLKNDRELIKLQKEKIERLENELNQIKESPFQSSEWEFLDYHIYNEVKLKFSFPNKLSRTVTVLRGEENISNILGYTEEEIKHYWQVGKYYKKFEDHPLEKIITNQSKRELKDRIRNMPTLFENLKHMIGNHYIPVGIGFIAKEGHVVHAISYNKIDWKNRYVISKTQFLLDE